MRVLKKIYIIYTLFWESKAFASESNTSAGGEELRKSVEVQKHSSQDTTRCPDGRWMGRGPDHTREYRGGETGTVY